MSNVGTQMMIFDPPTQTVAVVMAGPQGPPGLQGPPGNNNAPISYTHTQVSAASSWVIDHNLAFNPNVIVQDDSGNEIECGVVYHTVNQIELQFLVPKTGTARLS